MEDLNGFIDNYHIIIMLILHHLYECIIYIVSIKGQ